jgi:hypothetical protein
MVPWPVAGPPFRTAWMVCMGPLLLASGSSPGTMTSDWSPGLLKAEVALPSPIRLKPLDKKESVAVPSTKSTSLLELAEMTLERTSVRVKVSPKAATSLPSPERLAELSVMVPGWMVVICIRPPSTLEVVLIRALASAEGVVGQVPSAPASRPSPPPPTGVSPWPKPSRKILAAEPEDENYACSGSFALPP